MQDYGFSDEQRMLQEVVAKFVDQELMPYEQKVLARGVSGEGWNLTDEEESDIRDLCKKIGLWGLDVPEEYGGANMSAMGLVIASEEIARTCTPFTVPPDSPNLHMLMKAATPYQREKYLLPYAAGETVSAMGISEPAAGGDPAGMITKAVKDGDEWVINGRKIWISKAAKADFTILMARTSPGKRQDGVTAFIIDKDTPGYNVERAIPMIGGRTTYEISIENCRVHERQILGEVDRGYDNMQLRLNVRRLQMGARSVGTARRALKMLCEHSLQRSTFGVPLADRQAIQWWIADAEIAIHATRLMVYHAAQKAERGEPLGNDASMIKVFATEMAAKVVDCAQQALGAMGMTKEHPIQMLAERVRLFRIYEGPSEVHRMALARRVLREYR